MPCTAPTQPRGICRLDSASSGRLMLPRLGAAAWHEVPCPAARRRVRSRLDDSVAAAARAVGLPVLTLEERRALRIRAGPSGARAALSAVPHLVAAQPLTHGCLLRRCRWSDGCLLRRRRWSDGRFASKPRRSAGCRALIRRRIGLQHDVASDHWLRSWASSHRRSHSRHSRNRPGNLMTILSLRGSARFVGASPAFLRRRRSSRWCAPRASRVGEIAHAVLAHERVVVIRLAAVRTVFIVAP
jgi:hypothetical protein